MLWQIFYVTLATITLISTGASTLRAEEESKWSSLKVIQLMEPESKDDELRKLQKLRFNEALAEVKDAVKIYEEGLRTGSQYLEVVFQSSQRLTDSAIDLHPDPNEQIKILEGQLARAQEMEDIVRERTEHGVNSTVLLHRATGYRLNTEITLLKARRNLEKAGNAK